MTALDDRARQALARRGFALDATQHRRTALDCGHDHEPSVSVTTFRVILEKHQLSTSDV